MTTFSELGLIPELLRAIADSGYETPTPIQVRAIPPALSGVDLLGCAQTGTGKTAGFLLPTLQRLFLGSGPRRRDERRPIKALVLTPTRELAAQIGESAAVYGKYLPLRHTVIFGGVGQGPQREQLRAGIDLLIATPGRLMDHMEQRTVNFSSLEVLILDEADRMLDMGFIPAVRRILRALPTSRQTLFFSATMPPEIEHIVRETLRSPTVIEVGPRARPVDTVRQVVCPVHSDLKRDLLCHLLKDGDLRHVLVFTRTKARAERLAKHLARTGRRVASIHGNKSQGARVQALSRFKSGQIDVLVATDIAARGIDVDGISHVINFDVPNVPEDYVHRIGRTARAEATGDAISLVCEEEAPYVRSIEKLTGIPIPWKVVAGFEVGPWATRPTPSHSQEQGRRPREGSHRNGAHRSGPRRSPETAGTGGASGGRPGRRHRTGGSRGYSGRR